MDAVVDAGMPPEELLGLDAGALTDCGLIDAMTAARRLASQAQAMELAAVAELARRRSAEDADSGVEMVSPRDYVHDEVAEALTLTANAADDLIRFATELTGRLPRTYAALAAGDIDCGKARTLWHGTDQINDELAAIIEGKVLSRAPGQTTGEIRAKIRRLVKRLDPDALTRRRENAETRRSVQLVDTDDGTAHLTGADLPADAASAAYNRVNAIAVGLKREGDQRGIGQLRADVFLALLRGTLTTAEPPPDSADRPIAEQVCSAADEGWTGVDDAVADAVAQAARGQLTTLAGRLPERHRGLAVLIAQAGEHIAASLTGLKARWCVPGHDHPSYRVPAGMRRLIEHRDRRCCFPGCRQPVQRCDADHSIPFHRGGATCPCNVTMLYRRHHRVKQTNGWRVGHIWPGVLLWIGPTGHWRITSSADRE